MNTEPQPKYLMPEPTFTVQEWLAKRMVPTAQNKPVRYAKWWLTKQLARVSEQLQFLDFDGGHRLYVTLQQKRFRVLGISRYGILTLQDASNDATPVLYHGMVSLDHFSDWSNTPEGPLDDSKFVPYDNLTS